MTKFTITGQAKDFIGHTARTFKDNGRWRGIVRIVADVKWPGTLSKVMKAPPGKVYMDNAGDLSVLKDTTLVSVEFTDSELLEWVKKRNNL